MQLKKNANKKNQIPSEAIIFTTVTVMEVEVRDVTSRTPVYL